MGAFDDLIPQSRAAGVGAFDDLIPQQRTAGNPFVQPEAKPGDRFGGNGVAVFSDEDAPFQGTKPEIANAYNELAKTASVDELLKYAEANGLGHRDAYVAGPDGKPMQFSKVVADYVAQRDAGQLKVAPGVAYVNPTAAPVTLDPELAAQAQDIQHSDGFVDGLTDLLARGAAGLDSGGKDFGAALQDINAIRLPWWLGGPSTDEEFDAQRGQSMLTQMDLRRQADQLGALAATPINGEVTGDAALAAIPNADLGTLGQFIYEQGVQSLPGMLEIAAAPYAYVMSNAGSIAQQRAANNGRADPTLGDAGLALPAAVVSATLERAGLENMFAPHGSNAVIRGLSAAGGEAATEASQTAAEYTGGTAGTNAEFNLPELLKQMGLSALAGGGMGGAVHGVVSTPGAIAKGARAVGDAQQGARVLAEAKALPAPDVPLPAPASTQLEALERTQPANDTAPGPVAVSEPAPAATGAFDDLIPAEPEATAEPAPAEPTDDFKPANPIDPAKGLEILGQNDFGTQGEDGEWDLDEAKIAASVERVRLALEEGRPVNFIRDDEGAEPVAAVRDGKIIMADGRPHSLISVVAEPDDFYRFEIGPKPEAAPEPKAEPSPPEAPKPEPAPSMGIPIDPQPLQEGEKHVRTPAGNKVRTKFEVVDASELNKATGQLQNRDRSRETTDLQVQDIISKFDPELLGEDPSSDRGAPIIDEAGTVLSGNGRMLALNKIFDQYPEQAQRYRDFIASQGHDITGKDRPVLVRRVTEQLTDEQKRAFVVESNKDTKLELSPTERARSDADNITPDLLAKYAGGDLNSAANAGFVEGFAKSLTAGEMGNFIGSDRRLTTAGLDRIQNAVIATAYGHPKLLERLMENPVDDIRAISNSLADVAPAWAKMRQAAAAGEIEGRYDITDDLAAAAERISHARKQGTKPADIIAQVDAFSQMSPVEEQLIKSFYNADMSRAASRKAVTEFLRDYVEQANAQTTSEGLFGAEPGKAPVDILKELLRQRDNPDGAGLFDAPLEDRASAPRSRRSEPEFDELDDDLDDHDEDYAPTFEKASFTNRTSVYNAAVEAAGLEPDRFRLLPAPRQVRILQTMIAQRFGMHVNVDRGLQERFAIDQMLDAFQNLQGMAHVLDLPSRAISLDGRLSLTLEKKVRYLGAFYPGEGKIALPKRSNSFAHEWGHALDYHLLKMTDGDGRGLSGSIRSDGSKVESDQLPADVRSAFVDLLNAMFFDNAAQAHELLQLEAKLAKTKSDKVKAETQAQIDRIKDGSSQKRKGRTAFYKGAQQYDGPGGDYWTSPTEMLARSFEAYVSYKAEAAGLTTEFIGKGDAEYLSNAESRFALTFPKDEERARIFAAYDHLFGKIGDAELTARGPAAERPESGIARITDYDKTPAGQKEGGVIRKEVAAIQRASLQAKKEKADRANDPKGALEKAGDLNGALTMSMTGNLRMIQRRSGSPALQEMIDLLSKQDGKGDRTVARTFAEDVHIQSKRAINRLANILKAHGLDKVMDAERTTMLRDLLTSTITEAPPGFEHVQRAAAAIRHLLDEEFYVNQRAGIDLGYTRNGYLSRVLDLPKVWHDQAGFVRDAAKVYEVVFDNTFGDPKSLLGNEKLLPRFLKLARFLQKKGYTIDGLDPVRKILKQISKLNAAIEAAEKKGADTGNLEGKVAQLSEELEEAMAELWDEVRPAFAKDRGEAWLARINQTAGDDFNAAAPDSRYTKHRELPPEADKLMEKFYLSDPIETVVNYLNASARRTAYARRFGPKGEKRKKLFERMAREGVSPQDQVTVQRILDTATGRRRSELPKALQDFLGVINAAGVMALLPRAVLSSLAEPFTAGLVTGNPMDGFKMMGLMIGSALGAPSGKVRFELARAMGIIEDFTSGDIMMNRYGQTWANELRSDRFVATMFQRTGLSPLTRAQKTAGVGLAHAFLDNLSAQVVKGGKGKDGAIALLRELGVSDPEAFAQHMTAMGRYPTVEELDSDWGSDYSTAQLRFSDMVVQNPNAMDRPELSQNPVGRVVYGITGFSYAYWRNIIKRNAVLLKEIAKRDGPKVALYMGQLAAAAAVAFLMQATVSTIRERLLNPKRWHDLEQKGELEKTMAQLAFTRTFAFGGADPLIQTYSGLKYQRDLSNLFVGPGPGFFLQNGAKMVGPLVKNSKKTNTAEYNAVAGTYSNVSPFIAFGLARIPGGPVVGAATGVGMAYVTSASARDSVATMAVGKKHGSPDGVGGKVKSGPTALDFMLHPDMDEDGKEPDDE